MTLLEEKSKMKEEKQQKLTETLFGSYEQSVFQSKLTQITNKVSQSQFNTISYEQDSHIPKKQKAISFGLSAQRGNPRDWNYQNIKTMPRCFY